MARALLHRLGELNMTHSAALPSYVGDAAEPPSFNPVSRRYRADPYAHYAELRARNPIHRSGGMVVVTRYEDVKRGLIDPALSVGLVPSVIRQLADAHPEAQGSRFCEFAEKSIVFADGALHARLRPAVARCLSRGLVESWRTAARTVAEDLAGRLRHRPRLELVKDVATALPTLLLGELLGLSLAESEQVVEEAHGIRRLLEPTSASAHQLARGAACLARAEAIIDGAIRRSPKRAAHAELLELLLALDETEISRAELPLLAVMVYAAGHDTTSSLIASALQQFLLLRREDRTAVLAADGMGDLVRETLRLESPVQLTLRQCLEPTELGLRIEPGERVLLAIGSANRDETVFTEPDRLDLNRREAQHLGFGVGLHGCLGGMLASMEAEEAVRAVAGALPDLVLAPDAHRWSRHSVVLRALEKLPAHRAGRQS